MRSLLSVADISGDDIRAVLDRSRALETGGWPATGGRFVASLLFLTSSLRTRAGFAAATARMGGAAIDISERRRAMAMSASESLADTLRTLAGYSDVLVVRCDTDLGSVVRGLELGATALVNGGDLAHHPTQALIDLAAIERRGPVSSLRLGISGDLSARVVRSLLDALAIEPPAELVLVGHPSIDVVIPAALVDRTVRMGELDPLDMDVVYLAGMPRVVGDETFETADRLPFSLGPHNIGRLGLQSAILCPLPLVDEIHTSIRADPRIEMFAQSDRGVFVRAAVLEAVLGRL